MTARDLANILNGREYLKELTEAEEAQAKELGLVIVFGYSDDNVEFRGAIHDEIGAYEHAVFYVTPDRVLAEHRGCECEFCGYRDELKKAVKVESFFGQGDYSWQFKTAIPHATFEIMEGADKFCQGIVFKAEDVKP